MLLPGVNYIESRLLTEIGDSRLSSLGCRTWKVGEKKQRKKKKQRRESWRGADWRAGWGISSVQADVRTIRGAPQCIVHISCQP